ncbi:hypothetical protein [Aureimonas leprariae]|uniref:Uncharacterized protein n=1 Tax=Plantimonas leprariae TaxID=2615207 RepID=A0A7V7TYI8_9HYPH|nr:hypothetical protein [Aureimonas leprariae]KAB0682767.1 hypothetical protein F6X38_01410 [Aureimonas leprariae]
MRRSALPLFVACLVAVGGEAAADQITNGPQPAGTVVASKRGREHGSLDAARAAAAVATPKPSSAAGGAAALHPDEQAVAKPLQAASLGACVTSASVLCYADGEVVPGWPAPSIR